MTNFLRSDDQEINLNKNEITIEFELWEKNH